MSSTMLATDPLKRSLYFTILPVAAAVVLLLVFVEWQQGTLHIVDALGLPLLAMLFSVLTFRLWRRTVAIARLETVAFSGAALMYLMSLSYSLFEHVQTQGVSWNLTGLGYWSPIIYALAFLIFGVKAGLRMSLVIYVLSLLVWLVHFTMLSLRGDPPLGAAVFYQLFASDGLLLILLYGTGRVFAAQTRQAAQLEQDANTDALTQLHNRRFLDEHLAQEAARSLRQGHPLAIMLVDLDHFKRINDEYGHSVGDHVLRGVGRCLSDHARKMDVVGRWGGEEFLIILPDTQLVEALEVAERLRAVLEGRPCEATGAVTASFGVAQYKPDEQLAALLERADQMLYRAKGSGRNQVSADVGDLVSMAATAN